MLSDNNPLGSNKERDQKEIEIDRLLQEVVSKVVDLLDTSPLPRNRPGLRLVDSHPKSPANPTPANPANPSIPANQPRPNQAPPTSPPERTPSYTELKQMWSDRFEKVYLSVLLDKYHGNVTAASTRAKVDRSNFLRLLRKHGLKSDTYRKAA